MSQKDKWANFTKSFTNISDTERVSTDTYRDVITYYKDFNVDEIHVKHMYYGEKGRILEFILDSFGNLVTIAVWRLGKFGGKAYWDPDLVKIVNRPKRRRKTKIKAELKVKPITEGKKKGIASNKDKKTKRPSDPPAKEKKKKRPTAKPTVTPAKRCPDHPKYTGARTPRSGCQMCLAYYYSKHPEKTPA